MPRVTRRRQTNPIFARKRKNGDHPAKRGKSLPTEKQLAKEKAKSESMRAITDLGANGVPTRPSQGRPTNYNPELHPRLLIKYMSQGMSKMTACVYIGMTKDEMLVWPKRYKEFHDAMKYGSMLSESWWEEMGRLNLTNKDFNSTLYTTQMGNRFGWNKHKDARNQGPTEEEAQFNDSMEAELIQDEQHKPAKILKILSESGAIQPAVGEPASTEIN